MREAKERAGALVPEYHRATPECPHPERWSMYDSMTAEVEVLEFLRTLVTTIKPEPGRRDRNLHGRQHPLDRRGAAPQRLWTHRQLRIRSAGVRRPPKKRSTPPNFAILSTCATSPAWR